MAPDEREFLSILGYFYLQNQKFDKAVVLFEALRELLPGDRLVAKSLCYAYLMTEQYTAALKIAEWVDSGQSPAEDGHIGLVLKSKSLWGVGRTDEARQLLNRFIKTVGYRRETQSG
jgi:tetratricopeptide (TPR) repeat protein